MRKPLSTWTNDMAESPETSKFTIDMRSSSPEADCLDCLVALPLAIERMRAASDVIEIPELIMKHTLDAFSALGVREDRAIFIVAAGAQDHLYRHVAQLAVMDQYTVAYFSKAVHYFFAQLSGHNVRTFYILDNTLRDDRFAAMLKLFEMAGIAIVTPRVDGREWPSLSARIRERLETVGHVAYVEPDAEVNHLEAVQILAREMECVATFRNHAPEQPEFQVIKLP